MNKPAPTHQTGIDIFNRQLDRVIRGGGGAALDNSVSPDETRALQLAQNLAHVDFSGSSAIRQSLRRRFSERIDRYPARFSSLYRLFFFREARSLAGLSMAVLLAFLLVYGLLSPQQVSATPVNITLPASAALPDHSAVSLPVAAAHSQDFYPRPVPTPLAMSASSGQATTFPERTPARSDSASGNQFPVITTTTK